MCTTPPYALLVRLTGTSREDPRNQPLLGMPASDASIGMPASPPTPVPLQRCYETNLPPQLADRHRRTKRGGNLEPRSSTTPLLKRTDMSKFAPGIIVAACSAPCFIARAIRRPVDSDVQPLLGPLIGVVARHPPRHQLLPYPVRGGGVRHRGCVPRPLQEGAAEAADRTPGCRARAAINRRSRRCQR